MAADPTRPDIPADDAITCDELEAALRRLAEITGNRDAYYPELARRIVEHVQERRTSPVATKDCGCGPVEPCAPHRDTGDLPDWEARARAAEATVARIKCECLEHGSTLTPGDVLRIIGSEQEK